MSNIQVKIFDTTLRDGQQCPGAGMAFEKNIEYAKLIAEANVDILEAGFPAASQTDYLIVNTIAKELAGTTSPVITALCQAREKQVELTLNALEPANKFGKARMHIYLPVDPQLMKDSLGSYAQNKDSICKDLNQFIRLAVNQGYEVEFSAEGYSRMGVNFDFVTDLFRAVVSAGATILNCPDTIGGACKLETHYFVKEMKRHDLIIAKEFPQNNITWSVHCHNDFGLALENSINGVFHGPARQIEGCFNGIGERAGNVSLEQCIMYIKHFGSMSGSENNFFTQVNIDKLQEISDFVARYMLARQPHWPITGENAARHSSGGHTNAIIKNPLSYQPFDPKEIGKEISFLFGPLSGGNHAKTIIENFGYCCDESEKAEIAQFIKNHYHDRRKGITDQELLQAYLEFRKPIKAKLFNYSKTDGKIQLKITGIFFDHDNFFETECQGHDSALAALHLAINEKMPGIQIENYQSQSINKGIHAISQSKITIRDDNENFFVGVGEDHDIEVSALKALIEAVNQAYIYKFRNPSPVSVGGKSGYGDNP